jgi:hypothetical protein
VAEKDHGFRVVDGTEIGEIWAGEIWIGEIWIGEIGIDTQVVSEMLFVVRPDALTQCLVFDTRGCVGWPS